MAGKSQKVFHRQWFMGTVALAVVLWIGGYVQLSAQSTTGDEATEKRYAWLSGKGNQICFTDKNVQMGEGFQETTLVLTHPVQVDGSDIKQILERIDTAKSHLIITDLQLEKKEPRLGHEVFELNLKLLKRDYDDKDVY